MGSAYGDGEVSRGRRGVKFDRLLLVLERLMEGKFTAGELADEFEVSKKTIMRDIDDLECCFVVDRNADNTDPRTLKFSIDKRRIIRGRLNTEEQLALALAKKMSIPFGVVFSEVLSRVEEKALRAAPPASDKSLLDPFVFSIVRDPSADLLQKRLFSLARACVQGKRVYIKYRTLFTGEVKDRTIEPAYLFCSTNGFWYVSAYCLVAEEWRTFSVDQIQDCHVMSELSKNKVSEDIERRLVEGFDAFHGGMNTKIVVRFNSKIRPYIERREKWHKSDKRSEVRDDIFGENCLEVEMETTGMEGVKHWLKQWIPDMRVLEPESLRDELVVELREQLNNQLGIGF